MNFLAHLWLADQTGTSPAGAVLGDFLHGALPSDLPQALAIGVALHRRIDARTDRHPLSVAARSGFANGPRRYAGILLDLINDHLLALQWREFSNEPFDTFVDRAAQEIAAAGDWFARASGHRPRALEFAALLHSYAEPAGIDRAIARTAQRMRDPSGLLLCAAQWQTRLPALQSDLRILLQDLRGEGFELLRTIERGIPPATL